MRGNLFDSMGNYLFCHECIVKGLSVSPQHLSRQRNTKRSLFQKPIIQMTKSSVEDERLKAFVIMPDRLETAFRLWWDSLPSEHTVDIRFPHERHGLTEQTSSNAKTEVKVDFLSFVDNNSQPNKRHSDSKNPTHYFLPKFKTISEPKSSVSNCDRI